MNIDDLKLFKSQLLAWAKEPAGAFPLEICDGENKDIKRQVELLLGLSKTKADRKEPSKESHRLVLLLGEKAKKTVETSLFLQDEKRAISALESQQAEEKCRVRIEAARPTMEKRIIPFLSKKAEYLLSNNILAKVMVSTGNDRDVSATLVINEQRDIISANGPICFYVKVFLTGAGDFGIKAGHSSKSQLVKLEKSKIPLNSDFSDEILEEAVCKLIEWGGITRDSGLGR